MTLTDLLALFGAVTGATGTVLGVITTYDLLNKNRVKLRVTPKAGWVTDGGMGWTAPAFAPAGHDPFGGHPPNQFAIEVVNLSAFSVTISDVGLGARAHVRDRVVLPLRHLSRGKTLPIRLESREGVTAFYDIPPTLPETVLADRVAYARTDCDVVKYGRSPIFDGLCDALLRNRAEYENRGSVLAVQRKVTLQARPDLIDVDS